MKSHWMVLGALALAVWASSGQAMEVKTTSEGDANAWWARGGGSWWDTTATTGGAHYYGFPGYVQYYSTYMQFDISSASGPITAATLKLNLSESSAPGDPVAWLYGRSDTSTATGVATQGLGGDTLIATFYNSTGLGWVDIDVTDLVAANIASGHDWACFSVMYKGYYDNSPTNLTFSTADAGAELAPTLVIETGDGGGVPEPASLGVLGLGLSAMLWRRRRVS